jgi:tetratricopeptide (TPR) repeat protein
VEAKPESKSKARPKLDPSKIEDLLSQANAARRAGQRGRAIKLYSQVVDLDHDNAKALSALSDLSFDGGNYRDAVRYGARAVESAPRNAGYRLKLGDAYYKRLMFTEAKQQYEKAKSLGNSAADRKLAKVSEKLGG